MDASGSAGTSIQPSAGNGTPRERTDAAMRLPETERQAPLAEPALSLPGGVGLSRWFLRRLLSRIAVGRLSVVTPEGERLWSGPAAVGPQATIVMKRWRAMRRLLFDGDIGLAAAYRDGDFTTPDLMALIELGARNDATLRQLVSGAWPARLLNRLRHWRNANSRAGSRRNITAHYDLGNDFYRQWLDESMTYSSALYQAPTDTLEAAQDRKLDRIVEMLALSGGEHVLEIGCGWGALAERLAREGCRVTAITLSPAQLDYAQRRITEFGLADRVELRLQDYRDVAGHYDRIVSIEMIEAVGRDYWPNYFATLDRSLAPGGHAVLQTITINDDLFEHYQRGTDFIQRFIFPGGCLPSVRALEDAAGCAGLTTIERFDFGDSYAETLREWRRRFLERWPQIALQGFDEPFRRLWEFYLCYCEAGFRAGTIDVSLVAIGGRQKLP
ncbi:cyclopropane-fatty-acyl-phospholipid synthase family protein [Bosea rubneri]|uniref:Cyclopropane-fatty-acyl-phospholipid synthase family protein n=1 Tax=Bosea rubneri TaxID=3075434 RepID=A0ABU3SEJ7_9HYPH|nr:cyclopropane-fatty-acyl-phospholipid synthase family protein [Bosea sp. ZW T0_25]MDU0343216.1 cyclopropane-fatty-acyl-phospholipid synthase family protein [Bosea sp. ZW T0_25]